MSKVCDMDCLNCVHDDCINDKVYYDSSLYKNRSESAKKHAKEHQKKLRDEARSKGLCIVCRKRKANHGVTCEDCFRANSRRQKAKNTKRQEREYADVCYFCGAARINGKKVCKKHYEIIMKNLRKARESENFKRHNERIKEMESRNIERWRKEHGKSM